MTSTEKLVRQFVAGPIWRETEEEMECWTAEVQTVGGYNVVAIVHGETEAHVKERQSAILLVLCYQGIVEQTFRAGWEAKYRDTRDRLSDYDVDEAWEEFAALGDSQ